MATRNPGHQNFPGRPAGTPFGVAPPPATSPFVSSGSVASRPPPTSAPTNTMPFSSSAPLAKSQAPTFRPAVPTALSDQSAPPPGPPPSHVPHVAPTSNHLERFSAPQFLGLVQTPNIRTSSIGPPNMALPVQPNMAPPMQRPGVSVSTPPLIFRPPPQTPGGPMASPSQTFTPAPPATTPYFAQQPGYGPPLSQPGMAVMQQPLSAPPTSAMQNLIEDFSSLSMGTVPGSMDPGLDSKALPRPLEGDVEPRAFTKAYPMNCNPKYFRLTTSGICRSELLFIPLQKLQKGRKFLLSTLVQQELCAVGDVVHI